MLNNFYILLLLLILTSSCQTLDNLSTPAYKVQELTKETVSQLNGQYFNYEDTLFGEINSSPVPNRKHASLSDRLFVFLPKDVCTVVDLKFTSNKTCEVNGFHEDQVVFSKKFKGRIKNGYFVARPKFWILPFVPLVFGANFERIRIAKIENGLIIDHKINMWAMFFIAGGSQKGKVSAIYLKKHS